MRRLLSFAVIGMLAVSTTAVCATPADVVAPSSSQAPQTQYVAPAEPMLFTCPSAPTPARTQFTTAQDILLPTSALSRAFAPNYTCFYQVRRRYYRRVWRAPYYHSRVGFWRTVPGQVVLVSTSPTLPPPVAAPVLVLS